MGTAIRDPSSVSKLGSLAASLSFRLAGRGHCPLISRQRQQREVVAIERVSQVEHSWKSSAGDDGLTSTSLARALIPVSASLLVDDLMAQQPFDALGHRVAAVVAGRQQPQKRPGGLGWSARANAAGDRVIVAAAGFAPPAVSVLHRANPLRCLLDLRFMVPYTDCLEAPQHQERAVEIIDTPAAKPAAVRLLLGEDKLDSLLYTAVFARVAVGRQRLENSAGDVHCGRIQHRVVVCEGDVLENHLGVVFIEAGPAAVFALHREDPLDGALA